MKARFFGISGRVMASISVLIKKKEAITNTLGPLRAI